METFTTMSTLEIASIRHPILMPDSCPNTDGKLSLLSMFGVM